MLDFCQKSQSYYFEHKSELTYKISNSMKIKKTRLTLKAHHHIHIHILPTLFSFSLYPISVAALSLHLLLNFRFRSILHLVLQLGFVFFFDLIRFDLCWVGLGGSSSFNFNNSCHGCPTAATSDSATAACTTICPRWGLEEEHRLCLLSCISLDMQKGTTFSIFPLFLN